MLLCCEGFFFIAGLYALIAGNLPLYGNRKVVGGRARLIGVILMLPGPLAVGIGFWIGFNVGASGQTTISSETTTQIAIIEIILVGSAFVIAAILALTAPEPAWTPYQMPPGSYPGYPGYPYGGPYAQQVPGYQAQIPPWGATLPQGDIFTVQEAARYLNLPEFQVTQLVQSGRIPASMVGVQYRITRQALDDYKKAMQPPVSPTPSPMAPLSGPPQPVLARQHTTPFWVAVVSSYEEAQTAVAWYASSSGPIKEKLLLIVRPVLGNWYGEDIMQQQYDLTAVKQSAVLFVTEADLPQFQANASLWSRVEKVLKKKA